jgi:hypothetical protein
MSLIQAEFKNMTTIRIVKITRTVVQKLRVVAARPRRGVGRLALNLLLSLLVAACAKPTNSIDLSGTEEFNLSKEGLVQHVEAVESLIAKCMGDAGFEYLAVDYDTVRRGMQADKSLPTVSDVQFTKQFGFGISTLYTGAPPQLTNEETPAKIGLGEQNVRIFRNLSSSDQVAYAHTLFGEIPDATFAVSLEAENFSLIGGCTRRAVEQVFSPEEMNATYVNPHDVLLQQNAGAASTFAQFAECMQESGFSYSYEQEIEPDIKKRLYAITNGVPVAELSSEARVALERLQQEEIAIAAALAKCGEP